MRRWLAIIGGFTVVAAIVCAIAWRNPRSYRTRFERISIGTHQADVLRLLGPPGHSRIGRGRYTANDEMTWSLDEHGDTVWIYIEFENSRVAAKNIVPRK